MKANQDGHDFAQAKAASALSPVQTVIQQATFPWGLQVLAEIIDVPESVF